MRGAGEHGARRARAATGSRARPAGERTARDEEAAVPRRDVAHVGAVRRARAPDEVEVGLAVQAHVNFLMPKSCLSGPERNGMGRTDLRRGVFVFL